MSRLDNLIADLCPDGILFEPLGEVVTILDSLRKPISKELREPGSVPYYGANGILGYVKDYIFDGTYLLMGEDGSVVNKDGSPVLNWAEGRIWVNNHAHVLAETPGGASLRYVYYYLQTCDVTDIVRGTPPKINQANLRSILIQVPPIEVQREIVRILDMFSELETELETELIARRRQYVEYRRNLIASNTNDQDLTTLRDLEQSGVVELGRGNVISKSDLADTPGTYPVYSSSGVGSGEFGKYGKYMFSDERITWSVDGGGRFFYRPPHRYSVTNVCGWMKVDNTRVNTRYLYHALTTAWEQQVFDYTRKAHPSVIRDVYRFAIPPMVDQEQVVDILDKFDALVNDISIGLPAELAARRKQYEYYRDRLLTLEEAPV